MPIFQQKKHHLTSSYDKKSAFLRKVFSLFFKTCGIIEEQFFVKKGVRMKKVAVFLARGFEEIEAITIIDYLRRAEIDVTTVAIPEKGSIESTALVMGSHCISVVADMQLNVYLHSVGEHYPDAVFCPGGMPGSINIATCDPAVELIKRMHAAGKLVAAICAAPVVVLAKTGILAGKKYTCYPGMEDDLANYCGSAPKMDALMKDSKLIRGVPFVFDQNVLTGRGPGTAEEYAMEFVRLLTDEATRNRLAKGACQRGY